MFGNEDAFHCEIIVIGTSPYFARLCGSRKHRRARASGRVARSRARTRRIRVARAFGGKRAFIGFRAGNRRKRGWGPNTEQFRDRNHFGFAYGFRDGNSFRAHNGRRVAFDGGACGL